MLSCSRPARLLPFLAAFGLALLGLATPPHPARAQTAVLTQNNDNARTGANTAEAALTPATVNAAHFGRLFTITGLNANVNGQALYAPRVSVGGVLHNVLYAYTSNNADHSPCGLYAFDADTGAALWHDVLPLSATYTTAAPVIDQAAGTIYVLTKTDNDDTGATYLRAFDIATGAEKPGSPVQVQASAPGTGDGSVNGRVAFDGPASSGRFHANDRPALLLLGGVVYAAFAHNSDSFPYHGWIIGYKYDGTRFTQTAAFCATPNGGDGGIWQSGKGLTADAAGYIYCSVGNGTFDADMGGPDYGMCYLKLRASDLSVVDWFAPHDEQALSDQDLDLGGGGVAGIPGTTRLFAGGTKFGSAFLLDSTDMGRFTPGGPDRVVARLDGLTPNNSVGQNPVTWDAGGVKYAYLWARGAQVQQFRYDPAAGTFSPSGVFKQSSGLTNGGSLAVSSGGTSGGILWAVGGDSVVRAFDATDVSKTPLWTSALNSSRDALGSVGHFQFPTVVNGKVYVPTGAHTIAVYGLLAPPAAHTHLLWNNPDSRVMLWNVDSAGNVLNVTGYGPYTDTYVNNSPGNLWHATALATGGDGTSRLIWNNADHRVMLWSVDSAGNVLSVTGYGPYTDTYVNNSPSNLWSAVGVSVGPDGVTHLLWSNADHRMMFWDLDSAGNVLSVTGYGPYTDTFVNTNPGNLWDATSLATGPDNVSRVVWNNVDHRVMLWGLNGLGGANVQSITGFGPYTDNSVSNDPGNLWAAQGVSVGPDNVTHLLWGNADHRMMFWDLNAGGGVLGLTGYGPYTDTFVSSDPGNLWNATAIATGPDGVSHVGWNNVDHRVMLWGLNGLGGANVLGISGFGPYTDTYVSNDPGNLWGLTALSAGL